MNCMTASHLAGGSDVQRSFSLRTALFMQLQCCRFVGMLPRDQLQKYLVRAVTGQGVRVQEKDFSAQDLAAAEGKVVNMAGQIMLSFHFPYSHFHQPC